MDQVPPRVISLLLLFFLRFLTQSSQEKKEIHFSKIVILKLLVCSWFNEFTHKIVGEYLIYKQQKIKRDKSVFRICVKR